LIVVVFNSGYELRMIAPRLLRFPFVPTRCCEARRKISMMQAVDLPLPNGPMSPRKKASDSMKAFTTGPGGV
jgi:hypothetical protein